MGSRTGFSPESVVLLYVSIEPLAVITENIHKHRIVVQKNNLPFLCTIIISAHLYSK